VTGEATALVRLVVEVDVGGSTDEVMRLVSSMPWM
jgi:hypothetical protein